eukprot:TCALIF_10878-PA protein Name:"Protein of unknown function" AED:0.69 eAED:0.70 QI:0/0/0/1/0/0/2/0/100
MIPNLQRFGQNISVEVGLPPSTKEYLQRRIESLEPCERIVNLLFDEVYSAKKCEYASGRFYGLDEDQDASKTVLCFMITRGAGSFFDVVCMVPLTRINNE